MVSDCSFELLFDLPVPWFTYARSDYARFGVFVKSRHIIILNFFFENCRMNHGGGGNLSYSICFS